MTSTNNVWSTARPAIFTTGVQSTIPSSNFFDVSCAGNCTATGYFQNAGGSSEAFTMTSTDGVWANARPAVFGTIVQNSNPNAVFYSVSCASAGNCTATGYFQNVGGSHGASTMTSAYNPPPTTTVAATTTTIVATPTTIATTNASVSVSTSSTSTTTAPSVATQSSGKMLLPTTGPLQADRWIVVGLCLMAAGIAILGSRRRLVSTDSRVD